MTFNQANTRKIVNIYEESLLKINLKEKNIWKI